MNKMIGFFIILFMTGLAFAGNFQRKTLDPKPTVQQEVQVIQKEIKVIQPETVYVEKPVYAGYVYNTVYYSNKPKHKKIYYRVNRKAKEEN